MDWLKDLLPTLLKWLIPIIILIGIFLFFISSFQKNLIFYPQKLPADHQYHFAFSNRFEEINFQTAENVSINALHFKIENAKGLIFYLHGNAGNLDGWGSVANDFLPLGYDVLIIDYREYGKSSGSLSEKGLYHDALYIFKQLTKQYDENKIVIYGRSIGTGIAARLGSLSSPGKLILESPYFNLYDIVKRHYPIAPEFLLRFKFRTDLHLEKVSCPVIIFHGTDDEIIPFDSGKKLKQKFPDKISFIPIDGGHHNDLNQYPKYRNSLARQLDH